MKYFIIVGLLLIACLLSGCETEEERINHCMIKCAEYMHGCSIVKTTIPFGGINYGMTCYNDTPETDRYVQEDCFNRCS